MRLLSFASLVLAFSLLLCWSAPAQAQPKPEPVDFKTKDLVELHGTFYPSKAGKKAPTVLMLHKVTTSSEVISSTSRSSSSAWKGSLHPIRSPGRTSITSGSVAWRTKRPGLFPRTTSPSCSTTSNARAAVLRLTPYFSTRSSSDGNRFPGAYTPEVMSSRRSSAIRRYGNLMCLLRAMRGTVRTTRRGTSCGYVCTYIHTI